MLPPRSSSFVLRTIRSSACRLAVLGLILVLNTVEVFDQGAQAADSAAKGLFLQVGAFRNKDNAASLKTRLLSASEFADEQISVVNKEGMYRIHVGPYESEQAARLAALQLRDKQGVNVVLVR